MYLEMLSNLFPFPLPFIRGRGITDEGMVNNLIVS
jgi:hypothetical protein